MSGRRLFFVVVISVCIATGSGAQAQSSLQVFNLNPSAWPTVTAQFFAFDVNKQPNENLTPADFSITENGAPVQVTSVSCPTPVSTSTASLVLSIDESGSMGTPVDSAGTMSYQLAQSSAITLLNALPMPPARIALQTCTDASLLQQDFTTDRASLISIIQSLQPVGGNDFVEQLLNPRTGALNLAKTGFGGRAVVLFTDAWWSAMPDSQLQRCKDTCAKYGIQFYAIIFTGASAAPTGIKSSLASLAQATGGTLFDGVITAAEAQAIALSIERQVEGNGACTVQWQSTAGCAPTRDVQIGLANNSAATTFLSYATPAAAMAHAAFNFSSLDFGVVNSPKWRDTTLTLTANNRAITVQQITFSDSRFAAQNISVPFTVQSGGTKSIDVRFSPLDSSYAFSSMMLQSDACAFDTVYLIGGVRDDNAAKHALHLVSPNGGEIFLVNDSIDFVWTGVPPSDTVQLECSFDAGATWKLITNHATGFRYRWRLPDSASNQCLARVSEISGIQDSIIELPTHPNPQFPNFNTVTCATISPDDSLILLTVLEDSIRLFSAINGKLKFTLIANNTNNAFLSYFGAFTRDSKRVTSGNPVILWDTHTGKFLNQYDKGDGSLFSPVSDTALFVTSTQSTSFWSIPTNTRTHVLPVSDNFSLSPDGTKLILPATGNTAVLWDAINGGLVRTFSGHKAVVNRAHISPSENQLVTASSDSTAKLWQLGTGIVQWNLVGHKAPVTDAQYLPDGSAVLTTGANGIAKLWNPNNSTELRSFGGPGLKISHIKIRSDGVVFGSIVNDTMLGIWEIATGRLNRLYANDTIITAFDLSNDGSRAVFGDSAGKAKLWLLNTAPSETDGSDSVWQIVAPNISGIDVDFGQVLFGGNRDSVVKAFVTNASAVPLTMQQMNVAGFNSPDFFLSNGASPKLFPAHSSRDAEVRFAPQSTGLRVATVQMIIDGDTLIAHLRGTGVLPQIDVNTSLVDFGTVIVDSAKDTTVTAVLVNSGATPITFDRAQLSGPDKIHFSIDSGDAPFTLPPKETHTMKLRFAPTAIGRVNGSITFSFNGLGSPVSIVLFGNGVPHGAAISAAGSLDFSPTTCTQPSAQQSLSIGNTGGSPLIVKNIFLYGADSESFSLLTPLPDTIPPGSSGNLMLRNTPAHAGGLFAQMDVRSNATIDSVITVLLRGWEQTTSFALSQRAIDLGLFCPGISCDTICMLTNTGMTAIVIKTADAGLFNITPASVTLNPGDSISCAIHFSGAQKDTSATIIFVDSVCGTSQQLQLQVHVATPLIAITPQRIKAPSAGYADSNVVITNSSSRDVTIDSIALDDPGFVISSGQLPHLIAAGTSWTITVRFTPANTVQSSATMHAWGSPCDVSASVLLTGAVNNASSTVMLPQVQSLPGMDIIVPMRLTASQNLDSVGAWNFRAVIRVRGDLLRSKDANVLVTPTAGADILLSVDGTRSDTSSLLYSFHLYTMVGDTDTTRLSIDSFSWLDGDAGVTTIDGELVITSICPASGALKVNYNGAPSLTSIVPNPVSDFTEISYHLANASVVRLCAYDLLGRCVATLVNEPQPSGDHEIRFASKKYSPGIFQLRLETAAGVSVKTMVVAR